MPLHISLFWEFVVIHKIVIIVFISFVQINKMCHALILSGSPDSFARYPKWAQTFENELSFEFKTRLPNALLLYTDDGAAQRNFFTILLVDGHIQVEFRLGEEQLEMPPERRPVIQMAFANGARVDDGKWHQFNFFQAWENVRLQLDEEKAFRVLNQRTFALGNIRTNSDVFIGGIPKEIEKLSSPLRRHSQHFAGTLRNLVYRLFPQGVSTPQLMDSVGTRKTDEDYCQPMTSSPAFTSRSSAVAVNKMETNIGATTSISSSSSSGYCQNNGRCYSANNGPRCDCTDKKPSTEVSFFGNEWLGYDLRKAKPATTDDDDDIPTVSLDGDEEDEPQAVWSQHQMFNITFRTNYSNALLLLAGDGRSHVELFLEMGAILARSQLAGSEKRIIRVQDRALRHVHFDDNLWHSVTLIRELTTMRLVVDDFFDQKVRQFAADLSLGNAFLFLGGAPSNLATRLVPDNLFPFRGCIKKAFFQTGPVKLNLIALADQGFGQTHVQTFGDLSYSCSPNAQVPEVFAFNSGQNFTKLPAWNSPSRGTLAFQFRTLLSDGLVLYHGQANCPNFTICDYLAFELIDGHLMASAKALNDGQWHSVLMERSGRRGFLMVDALRTDFSCPGRSANLNIDEPIFLGAVLWGQPFVVRKKLPETVTVIQLTVGEEGRNGVQQQQTAAVQQYPPTVWTIGLHMGFVGCLKNIRVNGINAQIAHAFRAAKLSSAEIRNNRGKKEDAPPLSAGCPFSFAVDYCARSRGIGTPCRNGGVCSNAHNTHQCDCANTAFDGPNCTHKPRPVQFPFGLFADTSARLSSAGGWHSEAEDIVIKFRLPPSSATATAGTGSGLLVLLDALGGQPERPRGRLLLAVVGGTVAGGLVVDWVFASGEEKTLHWAPPNVTTSGGGGTIVDGNWHSAQIRRRGRKVGLRVDNHWTHHQLSNVQNSLISINELAISVPLGLPRLKNQLAHFFSFHGDLRHFTLNGFDLLKMFRPTTAEDFGGSKKELKHHHHGGQSAEISRRTSTTQKTADMGRIDDDQGELAAKYEFFPSTPSAVSHHHQHQIRQNKHQQQQFVNNSFFTKAPLGCLRQSERQSCEFEPIGEEGFFTPVLPKPLRKSSSNGPVGVFTNAASSSSSSTPFSTKATTPIGAAGRHGTRRTKAQTTSLTATETTTTTRQATRVKVTTNKAQSAAASSFPFRPQSPPVPSSTRTTTAPTKSSLASSSVRDDGVDDVAMTSTSAASLLVPLSLSGGMTHQQVAADGFLGDEHHLYHHHHHPHHHHHHQRVDQQPMQKIGEDADEADRSAGGSYYEPRGGWPLRTRTWPDGRRVGPDGKVLKWQMLRPKVAQQRSTIGRTTMATTVSSTTATSPSSTTTSATTTSSSSTTTTTTTPRQQLVISETVAKGDPGLHFTFVAAPLTRRPSHPTPPARFSASPNDPTLYAVRPTTPMNGLSLASSTPPTLTSMDTASNQLGEDKKFLIGVGSLSIVVMVGAILLCVFCKRCNSFCSQLANAAGAASGGGGAQVAAGTGLKAGYTPIPPNEFASPQLQHHAMASFERNGHQVTVPPSSVTLRNGTGAEPLGNGMASSPGGAGTVIATQQRQTRVVIANGGGSGGTAGARMVAHETTSLINAPSASVPSTATRSVTGVSGSVGGGHFQQQKHTRAGDEARKRDFKEWYV